MVATHTSDRKKRKVTDTNTTNENYPRKLLTNWLIPEIIPVAILPIDQTIAEDAAGNIETLHALHKIISKEIVTDVACSAARFLRTPVDVSWIGTDRTTPWDKNTAIDSTRLASPVWIGGSTTGYPSRNGRQYIISPRVPIGTQCSRDAQTLDTYINGIYSKDRNPAPTWSKAIGCKFTDESSADVNLRSRMNLTRDAVITESPNFVNLGL